MYTSNNLLDSDDPKNASAPGVKAFLDAYAAAGLAGDPAVTQAGWNVGEATVAILNAALKTGTLSRKSIIEAARNLTFTPSTGRPGVQYKMNGADDPYAFQTLQVRAMGRRVADVHRDRRPDHGVRESDGAAYALKQAMNLVIISAVGVLFDSASLRSDVVLHQVLEAGSVDLHPGSFELRDHLIDDRRRNAPVGRKAVARGNREVGGERRHGDATWQGDVGGRFRNRQLGVAATAGEQPHRGDGGEDSGDDRLHDGPFPWPEAADFYTGIGSTMVVLKRARRAASMVAIASPTHTKAKPTTRDVGSDSWNTSQPRQKLIVGTM